MGPLIIFLLRISVEIGACLLSRKLVNWIVPKLFGKFISNSISYWFLSLCAKDRIWNMSPRTPERLALRRGIFWKIVPFPVMFNRYNIWVGLIAEIIGGASAIYLAQYILASLLPSDPATLIGQALYFIALSNRLFELNPPPMPLDATNSMEGIMWRWIAVGLYKGCHKFLEYASTPAKRHRRSRRTKIELAPFPDIFPVDILREIVDTTLHQIWEETDKLRDPEFSDVLSLMLTCKEFKAWVSPQFYHYIHVANPTRVSELAACLSLAIGNGDRKQQLWGVPEGQGRNITLMERTPRIRALSFVDFFWTLDEHLDAFAALSFTLLHLRRLNIQWSLFNELRQKQVIFRATQITVVTDVQPPTNLSEIAARSTKLILAQENIGVRYAYPLDASGQVPLAHRRFHSVIDTTLLSYASTKKVAIELYLVDEGSAEETKRSKSALPAVLKLVYDLASLKKFTRMVLIIWVGDEEYENWVDPQAYEESTVVQETKKEVRPQNTEGIVALVPLRKRELLQWSFSVLERNGLDFWEEIEKRIAGRVAAKERGLDFM